MSPAGPLQLVLVTPETTLLDEPVAGLRFPLYDGMFGVLPGRAPAVGRLGFGELKITDLSGGKRSYFVDGGFVQIKGSVVSLLTNRAIPADKLNLADAEEQLREARARVPTNQAEFEAKERDQQRARQLLSMSRRRQH